MVTAGMNPDAKQKATAAILLEGLAKTFAAIAGVVAALSILPAIPYAIVSGMETNRSAGTLLAVAPLLFVISAVAAILCIARVTILRFVLAVFPVTTVFVAWMT